MDGHMARSLPALPLTADGADDGFTESAIGQRAGAENGRAACRIESRSRGISCWLPERLRRLPTPRQHRPPAPRTPLRRRDEQYLSGLATPSQEIPATAASFRSTETFFHSLRHRAPDTVILDRQPARHGRRRRASSNCATSFSCDS